MAKQTSQLGVLDRLFVGLMVAIFAGIILHAPLTIWLGTMVPSVDTVLKAWKELLMLAAAVVVVVILYRTKRLALLKSWWIGVPALYILLHLLLIPLFPRDLAAVVAGLMIDLRYIAFFMLMVVLIRLYPQLRRLFVWLFAAGAVVVGLFALLQVFVLPRDFLSVLGYGDATIQPYLTVDENPEYIRINSTLRGPNPLGAFAVIGLAAAASYWWQAKRPRVSRRWLVIGGLTVVGLAVALWFSYSRSALVAAVAALGVVFLLTIGRRLNKWIWIGLFITGFAVLGGVYAARETSFVSNVILHENEGTGATVSSNDGHVDSLVDGTERLVRQPLGAGVGSTGSASLFTDSPLIIENQYLFIAHEAGWIGLALFLVIFGRILWQCWRQRADWLALTVLASGIGLALIGLLLPVWVDDTVAIIWWGLAGLVIGGAYERSIDKATKRTA